MCVYSAFCIRYPKTHSIEYDSNIPKRIINIGKWEYLKKGEKVATLSVYVSDILKNEIEILAAENVEKSNIFSRVLTSLNYLVWGDV